MALTKPPTDMDRFVGNYDSKTRVATTECCYLTTTVKNNLKIAIKIPSSGPYKVTHTLHIGVQLPKPYDHLVLTLATLQKEAGQSFCLFKQSADRFDNNNGTIVYGVSDMFSTPFDESCQYYVPTPTVWIKSERNTTDQHDGDAEVNCQGLRWINNEFAYFHSPSGTRNLLGKISELNNELLTQAKAKQMLYAQQALGESQVANSTFTPLANRQAQQQQSSANPNVAAAATGSGTTKPSTYSSPRQSMKMDIQDV